MQTTYIDNSIDLVSLGLHKSACTRLSTSDPRSVDLRLGFFDIYALPCTQPEHFGPLLSEVFAAFQNRNFKDICIILISVKWA